MAAATPPVAQGRTDADFVSTGRLPPSDRVQALVEEAHRRYRSDPGGELSQVYPSLARAPDDLFGVCIADVTGNVHAAGDARREFTIMSVSKPFVFALICAAVGADEVRDRIGVDATGRSFDSLEAVERAPGGRTNPMVNSGAIATTSLAPGNRLDEKWRFLHEGLSRFAGRTLRLNEEVHADAAASNHRNRSIARLLQSLGRLYMPPDEAVELYTRQCSLDVTAEDLAVMGATLADGGVNPLSRDAVVAPHDCHCALAVMAIAGLYETSGTWLFDVGLPGKSGIGGGIAAAAPGKAGLGTFAPRLDAAGNSVKGQLAARFLSQRLGLDLFASRAARPPDAPASEPR